MPADNSSLLEAGASSALPQSGATGSPAQNPAQVQALLEVLKSVGKPVAQQGPMTSAQSAIPPYQAPNRQPVNAPQVPQGTFGSRGEAQRASKQAMFNNIATIGNQMSTMLHERQTREMTQLVTRIQGATEGKQQAEAMLKTDPNNAEAKDQLQRNSQILQDVFADPKNAKKLQKAFNVPLVGDKGKQTPEYQGLIKAIKDQDKEAQGAAGGAMADRFKQQFPSTQQITPQAQVQMALTKAGVIPKAGELLTQQTEMLKEVVNYTKNLDTTASREKIAGMLVDTKDRQMQNDLLKMSMSVLGKQNTAQILATASVKRAGIMANAAQQDTQWRMAGQILTTKMKTSSDNKLISGLNTEYNSVQKELKDLQGEIDSKSNFLWKDSAEIKDKTNQIQTLRQRQGMIVKRMEQANLLKDADAGSTTNAGDAGSGTGATNQKQDESSTNFDRLFEGLLSSGDEQ